MTTINQSNITYGTQKSDDKLLMLGALEFVKLLYQKHFKTLTVVNLDYVVTDENVKSNQILIDVDLNQHLQLKSPDLVVLNPTIHVTLPLKNFPIEEDFIGFEYELVTTNKETHETFKEDIIVRIQLFDTVVSP